MTMPQISGVEMTREFMGIRSDMPIFLCTGFNERINEEKVRAVGIREFVVKTVLMSEIDNTIRGYWIKK